MNKDLKYGFKIGSLELKNRVIYSPLAGCSDYPFRQMAARYNPGLMFCEMVKMEPLIRNEQNTLRMLDYDESMRPIGAQICGSKTELAGKAAKIIEDLGFDVVDLNCGCPVDKVTKDGSGSGMLKDPNLIGDVISSMVEAVKIPVTVKIRAGWDLNSIIVEEVTKIAEKAGAKAIFVHGRTRKQAYRGPANWDFIKSAVGVKNSIVVVGNGDIFSPEAALNCLKETRCDGCLISRGTMGTPWIAEDITSYLLERKYKIRSHEEKKQTLLDHFDYTVSYHNEKRSCIDMRRVGCWYIKNQAGARKLRSSVSKASSISEVKKIIQELSLEECIISS